jgi:hypothetical protein
MVDSNEPTIESIRDDALSLANALRLVVEVYVRPYPFPFPEEKRKALAEAAFQAGRALGNHDRLKNLYKANADGTPLRAQQARSK